MLKKSTLLQINKFANGGACSASWIIHAYKSSNERRLCFGGRRASVGSCTAQVGAYVSQVCALFHTSQVGYIIQYIHSFYHVTP